MLVILRMNETQNVGMRDAHHAHVRAAPHAALLNRIRRRIENIHERHGAAGDAVR